MAEVTREMILEYMQRKGGVVKNVDLVRHFRKYLQVDNPGAKDRARELFKERVNQVAYIKADNQGEKYLYLKTEFSRPPAGRTSVQGDIHRSSHASRSSVDSFLSNRDSSHSLLSNRDSTHSILSNRDSSHSILSGQSSGSGDRDSAFSPTHSSQYQRHSGHHYGRVSGHQPLSGRDSGHQPLSGRDSGHQPLSGRDSGHQPQSGRESGHRPYSEHNSFHSGEPPLSSPPSSKPQVRESPHHTSSPVRGPGQSASASHTPAPAKPVTSREPPQAAVTSAIGDSLLKDKDLGSFFGGGDSGLSSELGGGSSFASDIFGSIGGFWSDSAATTASTFSSEPQKPSPSPAAGSAGSSGGSRLSAQKPLSTGSSSKTQVPRGNQSGVALQSYKSIPSSSPPPTTSTFSSYSQPTRSPSPPPPSRSTRPPSPPPPSRSTRPPSPPPPSRSTRPPSPPPPFRSTRGHTPPKSSSGGSSLFSSPPSQSAASDGDTLLSQMTSELSSFGDLGSLLSSFGDFSLDKPTTSTFTPTSSDQSSRKNESTQPPSLGSGAGGGKEGGRRGGVGEAGGSSAISEARHISSQQQSPLRAGLSTASSTAHTSPSTTFTPHTSPPTTSPQTSNTTTFTQVHPRPAPTPSTPPATQSPMRVPRRQVGPPVDPPPPPPSSTSPLNRRQGSFDGGYRRGSMEGSPRINVQRMDSPRSDSSSNGVSSPLAGDGQRNRSSSSPQGLPPLPPSAMLGPPEPRKPPSGPVANGSILGVPLRQDKSAAARAHSAVRRSRNMERNTNLESLTRASIMMTPPSIRRSMPAAGAGGALVARAVAGSREDINVYQESDEGSLAAPSDEYDDIDPLEKEWMLACASANMEEVHTLFMRDSTLINRRDFLHGYTALHWAAKLGRCDFMSILVLNGAFVDIKSGGFTPLHLAAQGGYDNAIAMLVRDHGASVNARDNSGRKPIDMLHHRSSEQTRALLSKRLTGAAYRSVLRTEYLHSFSQPHRPNHIHNSWGSVPSALESSDEKSKKRTSPRLNVRKSFSFRSKHKLASPIKERDRDSKRPKSHVPSSAETYDV